MFSRILVPLDGSGFSEQALPYAVRLAKAQGAELVLALVHLRHSPTGTDRMVREALDAWDAAHAERETQYLEAVTERLAAEHGITALPRLLSGEIVPAIEQQVRAEAVDLVVMTTHGRSGLERAWLGSVADGLLRHIDAPVLVIRPDDEGAAAQPRPWQHVVIGLDGSERAERAIEPALALVHESDARVTLLRVVVPQTAVSSPYLPHAARIAREDIQARQQQASSYLAAVEARLRSKVASVEAVPLLEYHTARAILRYAAEKGADLIALSTHGRGPITRLLMGSVTDKVVRAAGVPVLIC